MSKIRQLFSGPIFSEKIDRFILIPLALIGVLLARYLKSAGWATGDALGILVLAAILLTIGLRIIGARWKEKKNISR
ncbi:hypothetical protein SAMN05216353_12512 [Halobacillus alkaliphilus]|uniref:Uncharacterized protein n=1 Tax=Halobacillus alkaliphilus TaxID=396056 RepID=A0A1I2PF88_9BACI|nr:hypothetical protein [Halobacillus alkaliphilus]SFG14734.1 hypothetical protein SAMN05216353_12512 [Halobacillus alkaliphilus]